MSSQLICTICKETFPSVYWFKSDGICIDCFKTLSDEQKQELEARATPAEAAEDRTPFPSIAESVMIFVSLFVVGILFALVLPGKVTPIRIGAAYTLTNATIIAACIAIKRSRTPIVGSQIPQPGHLLFPIVLLGSVLVIILQIAVSLSWGAIFAILHTSPAVDSVRRMLFTSSVGLFIAIAVAPILEETIFRGIILDGLMKHMGKAKAIVISTLLFALMHDRYTIPYAMGLGLILGWIYSLTKSLDTVIILHAFNNLTPGIMQLVTPPPFCSRFYAGSIWSIVLWTMMALAVVAIVAWGVIRAIERRPIPQEHSDNSLAIPM